MKTLDTPIVGARLMIELSDGQRLHGIVVAIRAARGDGCLVDYRVGKSGLVRTFNPTLTNNPHVFYGANS